MPPIDPASPLPLISFETMMRVPLPPVVWDVQPLMAQGVRAGKLGAVKLGGEWRIRERDLMAFIEAALPKQARQSCHPPLPA
jgi:Helix-turn-helix domain